MIRFVMKHKGPTPAHVKKHMRSILKKAYFEAAAYWVLNFREKHFTKAGAREYGYTPRSGETGSGRNWRNSYTARKLKKFGHTNPLQYTGESRRNSRMASITSTSKGFKITMRLPRLNWRNKHSTRNMRDELTTVSKREENVLRDVFKRKMEREINEIRDERTVRL